MFVHPVSSRTCRFLTWSWVRSSTFLRTRRRVDRLPRSCLTSSSTARRWNSLVRMFLSLNLFVRHCALYIIFNFSFFFSVKTFFWALSSLLLTSCPAASFFLPCPCVIHFDVSLKRSNLSPCFKILFIARHLISQCYTPFLSHTGHPLRWRILLSPMGTIGLLIVLSVPAPVQQQQLCCDIKNIKACSLVII